MNIPVPSYLKNPETMDRYYGVLRYEDKTDSWLIEGEPCVLEMAKRLFPGSSGKGSGFARFKNNKRSSGDLNWLMHRYPLEILEPELWKRTIDDAINYVLVREEINRSPQAITPPPAQFKGTLRKFQEEGLAFLLHNRRTLLADEMGLGKTVVALAFLAATSSYPVLLIVPPHLIINWTKEIGRFLVTPKMPGQTSLFDESNSIHVIKGLRPYDLPAANIYLIHYLILRGWKSYLPHYGFKTVIFDEIQELRHKLTEKYSAASLVAENCDNVIGLSGTPIYNKGGEIWNVLNILEYHCLGDWDSFTREWCYGYGSEVVVKPDLLGDYLKREGLLIRRTKAAVLQELPPKRRVVQSIDFDAGVYSSLIQQAVTKASEIDGIKDIFERGRATREIVNETRQATGIAKASYVASFVEMLLEAGERVLLFAYHHAVFDIYMDELKKYHPGKITGKETAKEKDRAVEKFKAGETQLVIISLRAAAGIDGLQSATCVVFGELDWSPAIHSQAEDRAHRMGQKDSILCYYLSQFVGLMGDQGETEEDRLISQVAAKEHMTSIVEKLKKRVEATKGGSGLEERKNRERAM
ncbi:MAG: DEAD/DEAH box helicase [Bacillota bacterium]